MGANTEVRREAVEEEKRSALLNPDVFFKSRICSHMGIEEKWLEEPDAKIRFRQHLIEEIRSSEKHSIRATKILKDFLMVKHRDKFLAQKVVRNAKEIEHAARNEVSYRALSVKREISPQRRKVVTDGDEPKRKTTLQQKMRCESTKTPEPLRVSRSCVSVKVSGRLRDPKKALVATAEELQREIMELEHTVGIEQKTANAMNVPRLGESIKMSRSEQADKHQCLAKSIIARAQKELVIKSTAKFRTAIISRGFSVVKI